MKTSQKILLCTLSLTFVAVSLDAAKRGHGEKSQQVGPEQTATSQLDALYRVAQAALNTHFPILITGAGLSTPPQITAEQLHALRQAAGTLKIITAQLTALPARRATHTLEASLYNFDKLADDCITAIQNIVLNTRAHLTELATAIDDYNDTRGRTTTAAGAPVPRLRDAAIADERGRFRYAEDEIAAYDARLADLCMVGNIPIAASAARSSVAPPLNVPLAEGEYACAICLDEEVTTEANPHVWLGCCNNKFHKSCLIPQFTKTINTLGVPECALCRKKIDTPPAELVGVVPTVDALNLLFTGAFNGSVEFVQRAIAMGVDVNAKKPNDPDDSDYDGCTALHIAADQGYAEIAMLLLDNHADIRAQDNTGWAPIHWAAMHPGAAFLEQLITRAHAMGIDARALKNNNGSLPLHIAAQHNNVENIQLLLGKDNLYLNTTNHRLKRTALILAAHNGHIETVQALLSAQGIDVNTPDYRGITALMIAADQGHTAIVQALLQAPGINVNTTNDLGEPALMIATEKGHLEIVQTFLMTQGISINATHLCNALLFAAKEGNALMIQALLGVEDIKVNATNFYKETALILATKNGHTETVRALLTAPGINVNATDHERKTALMIAAENDHTEIVVMLRAAGASK